MAAHIARQTTVRQAAAWRRWVASGRGYVVVRGRDAVAITDVRGRAEVVAVLPLQPALDAVAR